jgi:type IV secretion system protein VirD4
MAGNFDPLGDAEKTIRQGIATYKFWTRLTRGWRAKRVGQDIEARYGPDVAIQVEEAIKAGRDYQRILERAERDLAARAERDALLLNPPPVHGSARWAGRGDLGSLLKAREAFDNPRSLLLGAWRESDSAANPAGFVHWDGDGHLMTLAPTRSGKARTTIIPNLLRYRGSAVVLDPKGELYAATSAWRAANVGPVYRIAPFDTGDEPATAGFVRHGFNPLARVRLDADTLTLAQLLFPRDPHASTFFSNDAVVLMQGLMAFVLAEFPPERRSLAEVISLVFKPENWLLDFLAKQMATSPAPAARDAAQHVLGKNRERGLPTLLDTLRTTLRPCWKDSQIMANMQGDGVDFASLKHTPATVYIEIPFGYMQTFAPWLRVLIKSAMDAMSRDRTVPAIPVLFVLDEFLQLQRFPEAVDAMRTLAGSGVRLWYFMQDLAGLEEHYGPNWRAFMTCAVRQYFGTNDPFTAELISKSLDATTLAYLSTSTSGNVSVQHGASPLEPGGGGFSTNVGEAVQLVQRQLLTPGEVIGLLGGWKGDGWRQSILSLAALGSMPAKADLIDYSHSRICAERIGAYRI